MDHSWNNHMEKQALFSTIRGLRALGKGSKSIDDAAAIISQKGDDVAGQVGSLVNELKGVRGENAAIKAQMEELNKAHGSIGKKVGLGIAGGVGLGAGGLHYYNEKRKGLDPFGYNDAPQQQAYYPPQGYEQYGQQKMAMAPGAIFEAQNGLMRAKSVLSSMSAHAPVNGNGRLAQSFAESANSARAKAADVYTASKPNIADATRDNEYNPHSRTKKASYTDLRDDAEFYKRWNKYF